MQTGDPVSKPALLGPHTPQEGPVTLAPSPPADAAISGLTDTTPPMARETLESSNPRPISASKELGALLPWAAGSVLAGCALIAWATASRRKAKKPAPTVRAAEIANDIEEIGERVAAQLTEQTMRLEELVARAEARIVELKRLTQRPDQREADRAPGKSAPTLLPASNLPASNLPASNLPTAHRAEPKSTVHPETNTQLAANLAGIASPDATLDPAIAMLYNLADQGHTPMEISKRTGRPTGQVELILNLRRQSMRSASARG